MKKIIVTIIVILAVGLGASAQERVSKKTYKVKRTSSIGQKAHNTFSKHKHYNGYKVKRKVRNK